MKKYALLILMGMQLLGFSIAQAEDFVDKRFYQTFNPISGRGSWRRFTPEKIIKDSINSYWYPDVKKEEVNPIETECELLENKMGYIKYKCPSKWNKNGRIVEVVITDCYSTFYPCALKVYIQDDGSLWAYWIPDGSRDDSSYDDSKPYSYDNNNLYKGCPKVFFTRKTKGCDYISELLSYKKFKYSDLFNPPVQK